MHTDIKKSGWVAKCPKVIQPYLILARLDRPVGIVLLLLPCWWGVSLASSANNEYPFHLYILFFIGAVVMRSAGCVINDMADQKLDKQVERTQFRPIASGDVSQKRAGAFLLALLFIGLAVLTQFNTLSLILGFSFMPFVVAYPYMKRFTWYPQLVLGFVFNAGVLIGWASVTGALSLSSFFLYLCAIFWTIAYDTVYAYQDARDDALIGVRSTALRFGDSGRDMIYASVVLQFVFLWMALLFHGFVLGSVLITVPAVLYSLYIVRAWDMDDPLSCLKTFKAFSNVGWLILAAIVLAAL